MAEAEPRVAQNLVTSENRAAFMDKKLDIAKPLDKVVAPDTKDKPLEIPVLGEKPKEEVKAEAPKEGEKPAEKKEAPIQERFGKMAEQRRAAEARAAAAEARAAAAEREAQELKAKQAPIVESKPDELGEPPKRDKFQSDDEYIDAKVAYGVKKDRIEQAAAAEKARIEREQNQVLTTWQERLDKTREEVPDFDEKIEKGKLLMFSNQVRDAIFESPMGPRMLYYFVDHPEEVEKFKSMSALSAVRSIGRLEADLTPKPKEATSPAKKEVEVSKAPAPISPLKGSSAPEDLVDSAGKFKGSFKQFKQLRKEGKLQ